MRPDDEVEAMAFAMASPAEAVRICERTASIAFVGLVKWEPICVFGVSPATALSDHAVPWLLGTAGLERHAIPFLRQAKPLLAMILERHPLLINYVDARNRTAIAWLEWMGARLDPPKPMGALQRPFHRFFIER